MFFSSHSLHKRKKMLYQKHFTKNELLYGKKLYEVSPFFVKKYESKRSIGKEEGAVKTLFKTGVTVN